MRRRMALFLFVGLTCLTSALLTAYAGGVWWLFTAPSAVLYLFAAGSAWERQR